MVCSPDPTFLPRATLCLEPNTQKARHLALGAVGSRAAEVSPLYAVYATVVDLAVLVRALHLLAIHLHNLCQL